MTILQESDRQTVQLLHKMPDGSSHIDWMIAQEGTDEKRMLLTFRLDCRLDKVQIGQSIHAERIADHRWAYLEYEGPLSGNRGEVSRLVKGVITSQKLDESSWFLEICWEIDSKSVMHQKLRLQGNQTLIDGSVMEVFCEELELIEN